MPFRLTERLRPASFAPSRAAAPLLAGALLASAAWAQLPDEQPDPPRDAAAPADAAVDSSVAVLYQQIQVLQDDLRRLQGVIEEQGHRIDRLTREQRERYIDLDQRLLQVSEGVTPAPGPTGPTGPATTDVQPPGEALGAQTEEQAYSAAFNVLKTARGKPPAERSEGYTRALAMFDALIADYPNGKLTANAFYWRGEIELSLDNLEPARQAFTQLLAVFGDHAKAPDARYKLGVVYHRLGEDEQALRHLDQVIAEHPDHSAARLARAYAAELR